MEPTSPSVTHPRDEDVLAFGNRLLDRMGAEVPPLFDLKRLEGRLLDWAMGDPSFKTDLFRLVDVLPALTTNRAVARHVREYLVRPGRPVPGVPDSLVRLGSAPSFSGVLGRLVRRNVMHLAGRFVAGRNAAEAADTLEKLHREGLGFTVDLLGETTLSEAEAAAYRDRYLDLVETLATRVGAWASNGRIDRNHLGLVPRVNVSMKISALDPHLDPADPAGGVARLKDRILPVLLRARELGVAVHLDLEHWEVHEITYDLFEELVGLPELRAWPHLGMTIQAYLRGSDRDADRVISVARRRGTPVAVRLVKGAYWDAEVVRSHQNGYPCPVFRHKGATDARFEQLSRTLLDASDHVATAFASHNLRSVAHAAVAAADRGLPPEAVEIQTLIGMAEPERAALRDLGYRVRVYVPVGELIPGMAYLVRRLLENTSQQGFLRLTHRENLDPDAVFTPPEEKPTVAVTPPDSFHNLPLTDFTDPAVRDAFARAVAAAGTELPREVPVVVSGRERNARGVLEHPCPSHTDQVATRVRLATDPDVDDAVRSARAAWPGWRDRPVGERAQLLEVLADRLTADRFGLAARQVHEVGKTWAEADADVAEAVDFCRYYAARARIELGPRPTGEVPGEGNTLWYEGRGPTAVIAPWNFPLAILTGMATAALVAGNPVLLKPAEQAGAVAYALFRHLLASGFPPEVVHLLPGRGEEIGARLARDPRVVTVAFTGSRAVGLALVEAAGHTRGGQDQVKRVVCEMGGKNAVVVDESADLDAAVAGVVKGAFGFAGQKCSACSRVITVGTAHDRFVPRLLAACESLPTGPAESPGTVLGPVIDQEAFDRLAGVVSNPGAGARPLFEGVAPRGGWYVPPAVFEVTDPDHALLRDELFGPVVAVVRVPDFDAALVETNRSDYALTGSVYSRTPSHLALARRAFRVGNLYLNRTCTGAKVGRHPFGGFKMSGLGTKAGGPGYLAHFSDPRAVCENTVRHGFAPEVTI